MAIFIYFENKEHVRRISGVQLYKNSKLKINPPKMKFILGGGWGGGWVGLRIVYASVYTILKQCQELQ